MVMPVRVDEVSGAPNYLRTPAFLHSSVKFLNPQSAKSLNPTNPRFKPLRRVLPTLRRLQLERFPFVFRHAANGEYNQSDSHRDE